MGNMMISHHICWCSLFSDKPNVPNDFQCCQFFSMLKEDSKRSASVLRFAKGSTSCTVVLPQSCTVT